MNALGAALRILSLGLLGAVLFPGSGRAGQSELTPPGSVAARFGASLALAGGKVVVGAPGADEIGPDAGAAYVFARDDRGWRRISTIHAPADHTGGEFGGALASVGGGLVIADPAAANPNPAAGIVYTFRLDGSSRPSAELGPGDAGLGISFGSAVAADSRTLVVGAPGLQAAAGRPGGVFVYARTTGGWGHAQRLRAPPGGRRDGYGSAIALAGDRLAVAAPAQAGSGAVFVYERQPESNWRLVQTIDRPAQGNSGIFGFNLALSDEWLVISERSRPGAVHLYRRSDGMGDAWQLVATAHSATPEAGDGFGATLALSGELLAVGAPAENAMGTATGAVHLFRLAADAPPQWLRRLAVPSRSGHDQFGGAILFAEDRLVVGAPGRSGDRGAVYEFPVAQLRQPERVRFGFVADPGEGLSSGAVNAIEVDAEGYLLLGTFKGGVDVYDGDVVVPNAAGDPARGRLGNDGVLALTTDRRGDYWVGTEDGLYRFDRTAGTFHREPLGPATEPEPVVVIHEARDGTLWTGSNGELYRRGALDDRFERFVPFGGAAEALDETYVSGIQEASDGGLWVLTKNLFANRASLYRVQVQRGLVERFPVASSWGQVGPLLVDSADRLWLKAARPVPLPREPGTSVRPGESMVTDSVWGMLEASDESVWVGTKGGLYVAERGSALARKIRVAPFLPPGRPWDWIRSFRELSPGVMLVGTSWGLFTATYRPFDGPTGNASRPPPPLVVSSLEISGREGTRSVSAYGLQGIELNPDDTSFALEFATLDYTRSGDRTYRYMLESVDPTWVEAGTRRVASFSNVPPGRYRLVAESRGLGGGSVSRLQLPVRVLPQVWQTWWFRFLAVITVVGLAVAAYRVRTRRLVGLERLRLRIAGDLHDDLSTNLSGIALLSERLQSRQQLDPGARKSVGAIAVTARGMLEDLRDLVWIIDPSHDAVGSIIAKMRSVADALFGDRVRFVVDETLPLEHLGMSRRRELLMIYKEVVHNAARHAGQVPVEIWLAGESGQLVLKVADEGVGFDPRARPDGHGWRSIRARAQRLGAELRVDSSPGNGTRVTLVVDL